MKITVFTFGTRGDIEPYLALGVGLQQAGHRVTLVAPQSCVAWIRSYGVGVYPLRSDHIEILERPEYRARQQTRSRLLRLLRRREVANVCFYEALEDNLQAARDADFIVQACGAFGGVEVAQARGIPIAFGYVFPFEPTREFPSFILPWRSSLGGGYNRFTYRAAMRASWLLYGAHLNRLRAEHFGLPPVRSHDELMREQRLLGAPHLCGYSPSVLPKPADWDASHEVTGCWLLPPNESWQPPPELSRFLDSGPPPVVVGFSSMLTGNPQRVTLEVQRALQMTGQRGVLVGGGGGSLVRLPAPPTIHFIDGAPYGWLFQRAAAVVYHGGPGTGGQVQRAGIPGIVAPVLLDQFGWGQTIAQLGVGFAVGPMRKITAEKLAPPIHAAVNDSALRARAAALGEKVRAEDGVARAVEVIERYAEQFSRRRAIAA